VLPITAYARHHGHAGPAPTAKANSPADIRKREQQFQEALLAIDLVLHPSTIRKLDGFTPSPGLGAMLQARLDARKRGVK
jgi:hypothetical protein